MRGKRRTNRRGAGKPQQKTLKLEKGRKDGKADLREGRNGGREEGMKEDEEE